MSHTHEVQDFKIHLTLPQFCVDKIIQYNKVTYKNNKNCINNLLITIIKNNARKIEEK